MQNELAVLVEVVFQHYVVREAVVEPVVLLQLIPQETVLLEPQALDAKAVVAVDQVVKTAAQAERVAQVVNQPEVVVVVALRLTDQIQAQVVPEALV
jgi:hypothetical protein